VAAILVPFSSQIAGGYSDLRFAFGIRIRSANRGAISNPVGAGREEIGYCTDGVSTAWQELLLGEMLFAATARIVKLDVIVIADGGKVT
jgi:hypothetical protein